MNERKYVHPHHRPNSPSFVPNVRGRFGPEVRSTCEAYIRTNFSEEVPAKPAPSPSVLIHATETTTIETDEAIQGSTESEDEDVD